MAPPSIQYGPPRKSRRESRQHRSTPSSEYLLRRASRDDTSRRSSRRISSHNYPSLASDSNRTSSHGISEASLARLNQLNEKQEQFDDDYAQYTIRDNRERHMQDPRRRREYVRNGSISKERRWPSYNGDHNHYREGRRVSGPQLEEGYDEKRTATRHRDDGRHGDRRSRRRQRRKRRRICFWVLFAIIALVIILSVAITQSQKDSGPSNPANNNLKHIKKSSIPKWARGGYLDPFDWYDTLDFNLTFTDQKVGGLYIMGLNSTWDDNVRANDNVVPLTDKWDYGNTPIRGMNLGGWLSIEPFITPSLFDSFDASEGVIDEWTLCKALGKNAESTIEKHYSTFVNEDTFAQIQKAGFDHVRIPYSYWAVTTYPGDQYVKMISWRYLLRGLEWARKHGLRVNLDLHGLPGSQNGWNHSGRQGPIGWLNGTDGDLNARRSLDIHGQLTTFFAQPRYKNLVTMYGLANEPKMTALKLQKVLDWTESAIDTVRSSGMPSSLIIVIGDGFLGLDTWQGKLQEYPNLLLDAHQYVIFNNPQLALDHTAKLDFACQGWTQQTQQSMSKSTGFGSFLCGEWSQADTDCVHNLNDVGSGSRWEGDLEIPGITVDTPQCPTKNKPPCSCGPANADPSTYSDAYKKWLLMFAEAQLHSYEIGWGSFYWTWYTETAYQWSWYHGLKGGTVPSDVRVRQFDCSQSIPDFGKLGLSEAY